MVEIVAGTVDEQTVQIPGGQANEQQKPGHPHPFQTALFSAHHKHNGQHGGGHGKNEHGRKAQKEQGQHQKCKQDFRNCHAGSLQKDYKIRPFPKKEAISSWFSLISHWYFLDTM